jgi:hypothetical protein
VFRDLDAGGDDYLVKPLAFSELLARVRALLSRGSQENQKAFQLADLALIADTRSKRPHIQPSHVSAQSALSPMVKGKSESSPVPARSLTKAATALSSAPGSLVQKHRLEPILGCTVSHKTSYSWHNWTLPDRGAKSPCCARRPRRSGAAMRSSISRGLSTCAA